MIVSKKIGKFTFTFRVGVQGWFDFMTGVGLTWFGAWVFNPSINSATVWFTASLVGLFYAAVLDGPRRK